MAMPGSHQINNLATALAAVFVLLPRALETPERLGEGLSAVRVPGRLQPWGACPRVWLDVGHNPHAAKAVALALRELNLNPRFCVLGMLRDKDAVAVATALDERVQEWLCAGLGGERGRSGAELASEIARISGRGRVQVFESVAQALSSALAESGPEDPILVFGSFVTAGQAAAFLTGYC
jgi:dihydrofolate synthase/folylpolyglutamate synthase